MITLPAPTFREWTGPLTTDLVREPSRFGLGQLPLRLQPNGTAKSICGFCSTGCGLKLHLKDGIAINATPDPDYPVNLGTACPKGWEALTPLDAPDRATTPLFNGQPVDWPNAMQIFCKRMKAVMAQHGPESTAFISTGQIMCEEMAFLGSLAKFGMGMIHGDGNTRQCMATAVTAYKESFGFDAPPFTYADFEESDVLVFIGANPCIAHPIMWQRVLRNKRQPEIIVVDPRTTETAMAATQHYAIKPKSDLTLLYGIAHLLIRDGAVDTPFVTDHTTGFEEFAAFIQTYTPEHVAAETGLSMEQLQHFADTIRKGTPRVSFWWTMGVNQSHQATRAAQAIINLALMTGNIGKPGTGANSITGQCNAMGSRLFSNTTNLMGGHDFKNAEHRGKIAAAMGFPVETIPDQPSLAYDQILEGIESGKIKALWIIATNPSHSWINQNRFNALLGKLDFFVVQDMYATTETAQRAHLFLPAAAWGEKEGTFINSERRIGLSRQVRRAPGQALSDFRIFRLIAQTWGLGDMFAEWISPEAVFQVMKRCTQGQPCDITGIQDYTMLESRGGVQWPLKQQSDAGAHNPDTPPAFQTERRLFADGLFFTPDQRARFIFDPPETPAEPTDAEYPFVLLTGRGSSAQWHTESRTSKSKVLRILAPNELFIEMHPEDATSLQIRDNDFVIVTSRRASLKTRARLTPGVRRGQAFLPMHDARVNQLTHWAMDPHSRQPSYKHCAIRVTLARD
ncbi:nitrate reductase (quinol-dependent) catalytic subunit [Prosthecobacter fusiformis]|uniref:Nitrate reductase (Quinol-dependent) catalytic subunit n=1 Tax=Prosthecobacter fusiformis TaxID=48464 RepID=A0A4R7S4Z3_9BACT|nr:nitrate reductase [Prosthecobacter fusiformis]TDU73431.1 nitrate reductase (quinol-dependent) catalytic subunit [Prosthecobacter fusiformis]